MKKTPKWLSGLSLATVASNDQGPEIGPLYSWYVQGRRHDRMTVGCDCEMLLCAWGLHWWAQCATLAQSLIEMLSRDQNAGVYNTVPRRPTQMGHVHIKGTDYIAIHFHNGRTYPVKNEHIQNSAKIQWVFFQTLFLDNLFFIYAKK